MGRVWNNHFWYYYIFEMGLHFWMGSDAPLCELDLELISFLLSALSIGFLAIGRSVPAVNCNLRSRRIYDCSEFS